MNIEESILKAVKDQLQSNLIEKTIASQIDLSIKKSIEDLFSYHGEAKKILKEKIESVMIPQLEKHDYERYIIKLDGVLTEILKSATLDNRKILNNFKEYMIPDVEKTIKLSDVFLKYSEYVSLYADTSCLNVNVDDNEEYESIEISFEVEDVPGRSWSSQKVKKIFFECVSDLENKDDLCFEFSVSKWDFHDSECWEIDFDKDYKISSLKNLDPFTMFIMKLSQSGSKIIIDADSDFDCVLSDNKPEWSLS